MKDLELVRDEIEEDLNEGRWEDNYSGEGDMRRSLVHATGLSAVVALSTIVFQRRRAQLNNQMSYEEPDRSIPDFTPLQPHPVAFDATDESDIESVKRLPCSYNINAAGSTYAASIVDSPKAFQKPRGREASVQVDKPVMMDRGSSPLPIECFDSEVDSEERFGLASGLWHFRPTSLPDAGPEEDPEEAIQSCQKQWLKQLEADKDKAEEEEEDIKKWKCPSKEEQRLNKALSAGDTFWNSFVQFSWGIPSKTKPEDSNKSRNKWDSCCASDF